jgi:hypothetical protein
VQDWTFWWRIDPSSIKVKCNVLTLCAYPAELADGVNPSIPTTSSLSAISVVADLCKPYCVTAFGCSAIFTGQGHTLAID